MRNQTFQKYEGITLKMLNFAGVSYQAALKTFAQEFKAETGATVEIVSLPYPYGWWYLLPIAQSDCAAEHPQFDLFCDDREFQHSLMPHLVPLNSLIEKFGYDTTGFLQVVYRYDENIAGRAGTRFGLPLRVRVPFIFYRLDLIKEFPSSWETYDAMLAENTGGGRFGLGVEGAAYPYHPFGHSHDLTKLFLARYWSFGDPLLTPDWNPLINSDKGVSALEMLKRQIQQYAPPDVLTWDAARAANAFLSGEVAVIESVGCTILANAQKPTCSRVVNCWSVGQYPDKGITPYTLHNMLLFKHCRHPEAAFEFMAYCTGVAGARRLQLDYGEHSARKSVMLSPEAVGRMPNLPKMVDTLERARPTIAGVPQCYEMLYALWEAVQLDLHGYLTAKTALNRAADRWTQLLAQIPPDWEYRES